MQNSVSIHHKLVFVKGTLNLEGFDELFIVTDVVLTVKIA